MPYKRTGRPSGAPRGNHNRLIHGLYSHHISLQVEQDLAGMSPDRNLDEIALLRTRLHWALDMQARASAAQKLAWEHLISDYLYRIANLINRNAVLGRDSRSSFVTVLEMIRQMNEKQHIR